MFKFVKQSYSSLNGHLFAFVGIVVSVIPFYLEMNEMISIKVLIPPAIVLFIILAVLLRALHLAATQINLPRIRKGLDTYKPYENFSFLALLDPYKLFTFNTVFSVFCISDGVEELIGSGKVLNVQQNEMLLIGVELVEGKESIKTQIIQNSQDVFKKILVKPMVEY